MSLNNPIRAGPVAATPEHAFTELVLPDSQTRSFVKKVEWTLDGAKSKLNGNEKEMFDWLRLTKKFYKDLNDDNEWDNQWFKYYGLKGWALVGRLTTKAVLDTNDYIIFGLQTHID